MSLLVWWDLARLLSILYSRGTMAKAADKTESSPKIQLGVPLDEFVATVEALQQLCQEGSYQIFLAREHTIKFIGEVDDFRLVLGEKIGTDAVDMRKAKTCLDEVQTFLQVFLAMGALAAMRAFERRVYDDDFADAKDDAERTNALREILKKKLDTVAVKLPSEALLERSKRLHTLIGPCLEDLQIEVISRRRGLESDEDIDAPFLRIRLIHSMGGDSQFPFVAVPWVTNPPAELHAFDLECDEMDIDFLLKRLIQAKELLKNAIETRVRDVAPPKPNEDP
jgi:hypothetical protein